MKMGKGSLNDKQERLNRLIGLLRSNDFWTIDSLASQLDVTTRTLQRDLTELRSQGLPIETERGRGGGISLTKRWGIEKINLNNQEAMDLLLSLAITQSLGSPILMSNLKSIQQKISQVFPENQQTIIKESRKRIWVGAPASQEVMNSYKSPKNKHLELLSQAFFERYKVEIKYSDGDNNISKRSIEIHHLLLNWPVWYLLSWDELRQDTRMFRVDRISKFIVLNDTFEIHHKNVFDETLKGYFKSI